MWKCSNCGEICKSAYCDKCGLPKEESVFDDLPEEEIIPDKEMKIAEPESVGENTDAEDDEPLTVCINGEEIPVYGKTAEYLDEDDAYIEPADLVKSKTAKSKHGVKVEEKREKRVAELEEKLKGERVNRNQVPASYKYEVKAKQLKSAFIAAIVVVVAICAVILVVMGRSWKLTGEKELQALRAENEKQKAEINSLKSETGGLKAQVDALEKEKIVLEELNEAVRVLESDGTYHMYGCDEIDSDLIWIYGREQIVGDSRYIKCEKCN